LDTDQKLILAILVGTVGLFAWGRWRHDVVALAALIASVLAGLVPSDAAFAGFGHPAVITVAGVLVLSRGLQKTGAVDVLARRVLPSDATPVTSIVILTTLAAALSAFMNSVGALALLMPVAIQASARQNLPPGRLLMPLAFGSILGGMTTLIGTPPNLIVSGYRRDTLGAGYGMFDFTPVGLAIALAGVAFIALVGWRLVPARKRAGTEGFDSGAYITEARVPEGAKATGMSVREVEDAVRDTSVQVLGLVRREVSLRTPRPDLVIRENDILVLEAEPDGLADALGALGLKLAEAIPPPEATEEEKADGPAPDDKAGNAPTADGDDEASEDDTKDDRSRGDEEDIRLLEYVVAPNAALIGRTAQGINLRLRYHINHLAISQEGRRRV
jgi:di/tricarboxylate transporter